MAPPEGPDAASFPRRHARTKGFTLGRPRGFQVGADGARVAFLRSAAGDDPVNRLWVLDVATGQERWRHIGPGQGSGLAVVGDTAFVDYYVGPASALDTATGRPRWVTDVGNDPELSGERSTGFAVG